MLEVGEGAGRLELLVYDDKRVGGFHLVEDRRQFLIVDDNELCGLLGNMRIAGEHHPDGLADVTHLVDRQNRLIMEGRTVIGMWDDLDNVVASDDAVNAGNFERLAKVDVLETPMRDGAAHNLAHEHTWQAHMMYVFGPAGDLGDGLESRNGAANLSTRSRCRRHHCSAPPSPSSACRNARST